MQTNDFVKKTDISSLTEINAVDLNNLIDLALPESDRGLIICTTDSALNTPVVPSVATTFERLKRYIWLRIPHADDTTTTPIAYAWNPNFVDPVSPYFNWVKKKKCATINVRKIITYFS